MGPVKVKGQGFTGRPGEPSDHHANLAPGKGDREEDGVARTSDMDAAPGSLPQPRGAACEDSLGTSNRKIQWVECSGNSEAPRTQQVFILYLNILRLLASQLL